MSTQADPRPLIGEPLPLDLLNTQWTDDGAYDLLAQPGGLAIWLSSNGLTAPETPETLDALIATREALFALAPPDPEPAAREMLNETLRRGRIRRVLGPGGPESVLETD